jgi:CDP-diacylglycerol--serine O-phosphatidyltransferase
MKATPAQYLHPTNLVTYLALLAALSAIVAAKEFESAAAAGGLIALSVLADTLDGRFARLFGGNDDQRRFGAQLDSLADALSFGLAPIACVYLLLSFESATMRWIWCAAAFSYVISTITRLGFYNLHTGGSAGFVGVPAPAVGLIWSSYLLVHPSVVASIVLLLVCAVAMVYPIHIPRPRRSGLLAFISWSVLLMIIHSTTWLTVGGAP